MIVRRTFEPINLNPFTRTITTNTVPLWFGIFFCLFFLGLLLQWVFGRVRPSMLRGPQHLRGTQGQFLFFC